MLESVVATLSERALAIVNVNCTVLMQEPKLGPHRRAIRERLAHGLGIEPARVNVKATTGEGIGFVGRGEGVAALADRKRAPAASQSGWPSRHSAAGCRPAG